MSKIFFPMFSCRNLMVLVFEFKSLIHFKLFLGRCRKESSISFLRVVSSFPSTTCWRVYLFPSKYSRLPVTSHSTVHAGVCLWDLYSVALVHVSVFVPGPYCFNDYSFLVSFEIRNCDAFGFVLSQNCFFCLWSFMVP